MFAILGDVGGTNTRLALAKSTNSRILNVQYFENAKYQNLDQIITTYLQNNQLNNHGMVDYAALAVAAPIFEDKVELAKGQVSASDFVELTNVNFTFSQTGYKKKYGFKKLKVMNDFTALAYSLPHLCDADLIKVGGGKAIKNANKLVIGPGTGLGMSALIPCQIGNNIHWEPIPSEPGHSTFSPNTPREFALAKQLRKIHYRVSVERLISGIGIKTIYDTLAKIDALTVVNLAPQQITSLALEGADPLAVESINIFCEILGRVAGDHCLHFSARGGVYIAGGIIPKILPFFLKSNFRKIFEEKGRMAPITSNVATHIITHKYPALIGALASLDQQFLQN